jgi:hypothetical protein
VLQRGVDEGLVRRDVDLEHAVDLLVGPMAYRNLIRNDPPPGPELAGRIVDDVLVALAPRRTPDDRPAPALTHKQVLTVLSGCCSACSSPRSTRRSSSTAIRTIADDLEGQTAQAWVTTRTSSRRRSRRRCTGSCRTSTAASPFYLFAISIFIVGSVLCGTAQDIYQLAAYRAVQGSAPAA